MYPMKNKNEIKEAQLITVRFSCVEQKAHSELMKKRQEKLTALRDEKINKEDSPPKGPSKKELTNNNPFNLQDRIYGLGPDSYEKPEIRQTKVAPIIQPSIRKFSPQESKELVKEYDQLVQTKVAEFTKGHDDLSNKPHEKLFFNQGNKESADSMKQTKPLKLIRVKFSCMD